MSGVGQTIPPGSSQSGRMDREMVEMAVVFNLLKKGGMVVLVQLDIHSFVKERKPWWEREQ